MKRVILTLSVAIGLLAIQAKAEQAPNQFGYYFQKADIRNISSNSVELRFCSHSNCPWKKFKVEQTNAWAIKSVPVEYGKYFEGYLKSPANEQHFFFVNRKDETLIYSSLYGHRQEITRPLPPQNKGGL